MTVTSWGLLCVLVGTAFIAFDGYSFVQTVRTVVGMNEESLKTLMEQKGIVWGGGEKILEKVSKKSGWVLVAGLGLIVIGTLLQFVGSLG